MDCGPSRTDVLNPETNSIFCIEKTETKHVLHASKSEPMFAEQQYSKQSSICLSGDGYLLEMTDASTSVHWHHRRETVLGAQSELVNKCKI